MSLDDLTCEICSTRFGDVQLYWLHVVEHEAGIRPMDEGPPGQRTGPEARAYEPHESP